MLVFKTLIFGALFDIKLFEESIALNEPTGFMMLLNFSLDRLILNEITTNITSIFRISNGKYRAFNYSISFVLECSLWDKLKMTGIIFLFL